jgi:hypothetical protein
MRLATALGSAVGALLLLALPSTARALENDAQLWATLHVGRPIGDRVAVNLVLQPRFGDDISELERMVVRPWVSVRAFTSTFASLGYDAHIIEHPDSLLENRIWQQMLASWKPEGLELDGRLRIEERFIEHTSGALVRLRARLGLIRPLEGRYALVGRNEVLVNLNSLSRGADTSSGFDENRFFAGLRFGLGEHSTLEAGYQMVYDDRPGDDEIGHTLMIGLSFPP